MIVQLQIMFEKRFTLEEYFNAVVVIKNSSSLLCYDIESDCNQLLYLKIFSHKNLS